MFGGIADFANLIKNLPLMKARMEEVEQTLAQRTFDADSGAGAVTATVNGKLALTGIKLTPEAVRDGDVELLEDLIKSAVASAQRKAAEGAREEIQRAAGGMNIPGLDKMLNKI